MVTTEQHIVVIVTMILLTSVVLHVATACQLQNQTVLLDVDRLMSCVSWVLLMTCFMCFPTVT